MTFRPWSSDEDSQIIKLYGEGLKVDAIGEALDRHSKSTAKRMTYLRRMGALPWGRNKPLTEIRTADPGIILNRDDQLVALCQQRQQQGGFPRAIVVEGRTFWINADRAPWRHAGPENLDGKALRPQRRRVVPDCAGFRLFPGPVERISSVL